MSEKPLTQVFAELAERHRGVKVTLPAPDEEAAEVRALRDLVAQQAKRADEAEAREVSAQVRIVEMRRELDAARGELSMLRRRLEAK